MTFVATPRMCAISDGPVQCRSTCDGEHVTCAAHREREPDLLERYTSHVDAADATTDLARAEAQAIREWRDRAGITARAQEIAAELAVARKARVAARKQAVEDAIADAAVEIEGTP